MAHGVPDCDPLIRLSDNSCVPMIQSDWAYNSIGDHVPFHDVCARAICFVMYSGITSAW